MKTYWFEIVGEDSVLCGEEFFVESDTQEHAEHLAEFYFPDEEIEFNGEVSEFEAEMLGLDTY